MSLLFLSDNHYNTFVGRHLYEALREEFSFTYLEDDYSDYLLEGDLSSHRALVTTAIGGTPGAPHAPAEAAERVRAWLATGVPLILLHGGSATFWEWDWWRAAVGLRWVRGQDPDGVAASTHPVIPFALQRVKSRHPLAAELRAFDVPTDELYIELEETAPIQRLLEVSHEGRSYPMAYVGSTPWGGRLAGYLPGHDSSVVTHPDNLANVRALLRFATAP